MVTRSELERAVRNIRSKNLKGTALVEELKKCTSDPRFTSGWRNQWLTSGWRNGALTSPYRNGPLSSPYSSVSGAVDYVMDQIED